MKKLTILSLMLMGVTTINGQLTIEPKEWLPCDEITLTVDITLGDCQSIVDSEGPLYLWTWLPAEDTRDESLKNGSWNSSNEELKMTKVGPNLWSYTMVPTEFYGVDADVVYEKGFALLVKEKDGGGGGDCSASGGDFKTSDITLQVAPPFTSSKLKAVPKAVFSNDLFTFIYDNTLEEKASMQNLSEVYVYASAFAGGVEYPISAMGDVGSNPNLKLTDMGDGQFGITIIPDVFFSAVPAGTAIEQLLFIARKKDMASDEDRVDEDALFDLGCEAAGGGC